MQTLIDYFNHIPSAHRSYILIGGITFFWVIEGIIPLADLRYSKWKHAGVNLFFTLTTIVINFLFAALIVKTSDWAIEHHFGLLQWLQIASPWATLVIGLLLSDLIGAYFIHWLEHKVKWMWQFHLVHHSDRYVDTTTANRHHPGESVFRAVFTTIAVLLIGAPMWIVMVYQSLSALLSQFNHANIYLPKKIDTVISWIIVSPNMHKVHHHYRQPLTDTNYGNIFSIWDRLFGTFAYVEDINTLQYGIDTHFEAQENEPINALLKMPFGKYRPPSV